MTLADSIALLNRLIQVANTPVARRRYRIELRAHEDARDQQDRRSWCIGSEELSWYDQAYTEAKQKQELQP